ncbi:hypothetical protein CY34DRAFT_809254 [Suillus luteus UH-Slu-Lm8-n1]|uniref:Uncharacterized protein n=1 Tax=Suillus luteus UH-Slu-Lm8-n1 TaxID=930992 RepID=A0A0D0A9U7_9AGAM|nr:hypothetical protein CY34DRAFT_809254 [Suillus luteus UH-Slu-Lm8-n1]
MSISSHLPLSLCPTQEDFPYPSDRRRSSNLTVASNPHASYVRVGNTQDVVILLAI